MCDINITIESGLQASMFAAPAEIEIKRKCNLIKPTLFDYQRETETLNKLKEGEMKAEKYTIRYGSNGQQTDEVKSNSRNARRHGQQLLGTSGGGWVKVLNAHGDIVSYARYSPDSGKGWYIANHN